MKKITICACDSQSNYECGGMMKSCCDYVKDVLCAELALCVGRHDIPQAVDGCIFEEEIEDPTNTLKMEAIASRRFRELGVEFCDIYVTGLTPALMSALNAARRAGITVTLYHYNKVTGDYFSQPVV